MDFGSTFGSAGHGPMNPINGYANLMDTRDMALSFATLGLKKWQWEDAIPPTNKSVGYYESEIFHPGKWNPVYPIPPFENMTDQDGYWGAKIMLAFRDNHLRALVNAGQYGDRNAEEYLLKTMKERRDKIGRYWFGKINPLDYPSLSYTSGSLEITFQDLALNYGLAADKAKYQYEVTHRGARIITAREINTNRISLGGDDVQSLLTAGDEESDPDNQQFLYELKVRTARNSGKWSQPAVFWIHYSQSAEQFSIVGIEHSG
jgi:hypothetical protein